MCLFCHNDVTCGALAAICFAFFFNFCKKEVFDDWSEKRQSFLYLNVLQGIKIILYNVNTIKKSNDGDYNANAISQ